LDRYHHGRSNCSAFGSLSFTLPTISKVLRLAISPHVGMPRPARIPIVIRSVICVGPTALNRENVSVRQQIVACYRLPGRIFITSPPIPSIASSMRKRKPSESFSDRADSIALDSLSFHRSLVAHCFQLIVVAGVVDLVRHWILRIWRVRPNSRSVGLPDICRIRISLVR
jgi:hypothetical protein